MAESIYLVIRDVHYDQNWPQKAFEREEDAEEWQDEKSEEYPTKTNDCGSEFLIGEHGTNFRLRVKEVEYLPAQS